MEKRRKGDMWRERMVFHICLVLLTLLQITAPSSAQSTANSYSTRPVNVSVAAGELVMFYCGVTSASSNLTFSFHSSKGNYSLTCPNGQVDAVPQVLYGRCTMKNRELLAVWTLNGTSLSDNEAHVVCQQPNNLDAPAAVLHVYTFGSNKGILIGCTIGGFLGALVMAGIFYLVLQKNKTVQECFRGDEPEEDDMNTIVTKD
ncbi:uncharacterized protein LOC113122544 [Mastacembelus armatus]|uniref:uncharacterized protein LOC113122544 n=1 Tax=Mastacembelus armatus TaxID=205130 RepID=UPI000E45B202|nr:uncharacterized protein LOC113122544 [Mastacembelus armatus]